MLNFNFNSNGNNKEEKPKEQAKDTPSSELDALFSKKEPTKLSLDKEAPKFIDLGGGLFAEDKRPLNKKENKKEENKYFDINNKSKLNYQDEIKKIANKKEEPLTLKEPILKTNTNQEKGKYVYSENKNYKPQHDTYRELAIDSYSKIGNNIKDYKPLLESENKDTGFSSRAYIDKDNKTIVIAYKGTDVASVKDWKKNNLPMSIVNVIPQQFSDAENFYRDIKDKLGDKAKDYNIVFTGHSLGGTLAELMGAKYGNEAVTFNAYGAGKIKGAEINHVDNITNYGNINDIIYNMNKDMHIGKKVYTRSDNQNDGINLNNHKAENMGDLSKSVHIERGMVMKFPWNGLFEKDRI